MNNHPTARPHATLHVHKHMRGTLAPHVQAIFPKSSGPSPCVEVTNKKCGPHLKQRVGILMVFATLYQVGFGIYRYVVVNGNMPILNL